MAPSFFARLVGHLGGRRLRRWVADAKRLPLAAVTTISEATGLAVMLVLVGETGATEVARSRLAQRGDQRRRRNCLLLCGAGTGDDEHRLSDCSLQRDRSRRAVGWNRAPVISRSQAPASRSRGRCSPLPRSARPRTRDSSRVVLAVSAAIALAFSLPRQGAARSATCARRCTPSPSSTRRRALMEAPSDSRFSANVFASRASGAWRCRCRLALLGRDRPPRTRTARTISRVQRTGSSSRLPTSRT